MLPSVDKPSSLNNSRLSKPDQTEGVTRKKYLMLRKMEKLFPSLPRPVLQVNRSSISQFKPDGINWKTPRSFRSGQVPSMSYAISSNLVQSGVSSTNGQLTTSRDENISRKNRRLTAFDSESPIEKTSVDRGVSDSLQTIAKRKQFMLKGSTEISRKQQEEIAKLQKAIIEMKLRISDCKKQKSLALLGGQTSKRNLLLKLLARQLKERLVTCDKLEVAVRKRLNKAYPSSSLPIDIIQ